MKKKILILGGARSQIPVIEYAKRQGLHVITVDYLPKNPGHKISDEYYNISTVNKEEILGLAEKLKIDAISAFASDPAAPTAAYVSDNLGLVSGAYEAVRILSNKDLFRKFLQDNSYRTPWFLSASNLEEIKEKYNGEQAILKPIDSSGSKGIFRIKNANDLDKYFVTTQNYSRSKKVILEQFIEKKGPQIHGEGFVQNGEVVFLLLGDQVFSGTDNIIPYSTVVPSSSHIDVMENVHSLIKSIIKKVNFKTGGINIEVIRDLNDNLYVLEIGARNGGNFMPQLMKYATGVDLVKLNVDSLLKKKLRIKPCNINKNYAQIILHSQQDGKFRGIKVPDEFKESVLEQNVYYNYGDEIYSYKSSQNVIGVLILEIHSNRNYKLYKKYLEKNEWVVSTIE